MPQYSLDPPATGLIEGCAAVSNNQTSTRKSNDHESRQANRSCGGGCVRVGYIGGERSGQESFQLHSTTFSNDSTLPLSTILNNQVNGVNTCTANGAAGYDESPQLFWTGAPRGTQSFVVVLYDVTASFTHWGMYNIAANVNQLPENAGKAGGAYVSRSKTISTSGSNTTGHARRQVLRRIRTLTSLRCTP